MNLCQGTMGTEFGLYHLSSKTFIWLGKVVRGKQYQTPDRAIVAFMANQQAGEFRVVPDSAQLPNEEEEGWAEIGDYPWPDDVDEEKHDLSDGLVFFFPMPDKIEAKTRAWHYAYSICYDGCIGDVRIHDRALTPDEIHKLYLV